MIPFVAAFAAGLLLDVVFRRALRSEPAPSPSLLPGAPAPDAETPPDAAPILNPPNADRHRWARGILTEAFRLEMGRDPSLNELLYAHAVGKLESSYGAGWKGAMSASNNWGAVQCKGDGPDCIAHEDSYPDGTRYKVSFKAYGSPVDGARDMIRHIFKLRPRTAAAASEPGATAFRISYAMRREKYYGGFCPKATKAHGAAAATASFAKPDRDDGTKACAREAITSHAKDLVHPISRSVAGACGDARGLPLGTYDEADAWWHAGEARS